MPAPIAAVLSALLLLAGLVAGCSSKSSTDASLPDAATLLQQSATATKALTSAHLDITVNGKVTGLPLKKLSGDLTNVPATAVQGQATITMGGSDLDVKMIVVDGTLFAALSGDTFMDMGPADAIYDPSTILNPDTGLANLLSNFRDPKSVSNEKVNGIDTVKVTGTVTKDAFGKLLPKLKVDGDVPGTAWIEKDGDHRLVQAQVDPTSGNNIQMTLSDWNKPVTVTKPQV
jgi:lipoprotein LprG